MLSASRELVARENVMPWLELAMGAGAAALIGSALIAARSWKTERERVRRSEKRRLHDAEALRGWEEMEGEFRRAQEN
jgi:hypothetical protein